MPQRRMSHVANVIRDHVVAAREPSNNPCSASERHHSAGTGSSEDQPVHVDTFQPNARLLWSLGCIPKVQHVLLQGVAGSDAALDVDADLVQLTPIQDAGGDPFQESVDVVEGRIEYQLAANCGLARR